MQQSPIFTKTHDLLLWIIPTTTKFPREHRFVMAKRVQEMAFSFHEQLIEAGLTYGRVRDTALMQADIALTKLRHYLRLCVDMKLITPRQYAHVAGLTTEVGNLLGGWRKSLKSA